MDTSLKNIIVEAQNRWKTEPYKSARLRIIEAIKADESWEFISDELVGYEPERKDLTGIDFRGMNFQKRIWQYVDFDFAIFDDSNCKGSVFYNCSFMDANFVNANFDSCSIKDTNMSSAIMKNASFRDSILRSSSLTGSDLENADFTKCDLEDASLVFANIEGAIFDNADLTDARFRDNKGTPKGGNISQDL